MQRMERALSSFEILDTHSWQRTNKKILSAETQGCLFVHLILDTNTKTSCYKTRQSCLISYWKVFCHVHTFILAVFNKGSHKKLFTVKLKIFFFSLPWQLFLLLQWLQLIRCQAANIPAQKSLHDS